MIRKLYAFALVALLFGLPGIAAAQCTSPDRAAGSYLYSSADSVWQFCDGTNWKDFSCEVEAAACGPGTWTARTAAQANSWGSVAYGNGLFVAVSSSGTNRVMTSPDGITWTARTAAANHNWMSVTYGNGLFVAVTSQESQVMTSPDGITWTLRNLPSAGGPAAVTFGNGMFVGVGLEITGFSTPVHWYSTDGISWSNGTPVTFHWLSSVVYGNGKFVAVGTSYASSYVMTSTDGVNWTSQTPAQLNYWTSVTYGNGLFVAVSLNGTNRVMTSPDGITWTARTAAQNNSWQSVTYADGLFVAVASDGTNRVMTSADAITWASGNAAQANTWRAVTSGNDRFVAVSADGTNRVMTSDCEAAQTTVFLTASPGTNQSWTVPADFTSTNTVHVIGGGGGGDPGGATGAGGGGGGGAYSHALNLSLSPGASVTYRVGAGGAAATTGGDTFFNRTAGTANTCADTNSVCAKGGIGATSATGAAGGTAAASFPAANALSGGNGGNGGSAANDGGGGGGGAAGPHYPGKEGGNGRAGSPGGAGGGGGANSTWDTADSTGTSGVNGGHGRGGTGAGVNGNPNGGNATAGTGGGGAGGDGVSATGGFGGQGAQEDLWIQTSDSATAGPGGGGGGGGGATTTAGAGGNAANGYGGGGGGGGEATTDGAGGAGRQGLIVITYTPSLPCATHGSCSPAGQLAFETSFTPDAYKYCDGTDWVKVDGGLGTGMPPTGCPTIGDVCSDGTIYAGLSPDGNVPIYTTPADQGSFTWGPTGDVAGVVNCTTTQTGCRTGETNTLALAALAGAYDAAKHCANLSANGKTGWFLPAQAELAVLHTNRVAIGGFSNGQYYWSSSEFSSTLAWAEAMGGDQDELSKSTSYRVRCVRRAGGAPVEGPGAACSVAGTIDYYAPGNNLIFCDGSTWHIMAQ
jgi:hypothetical protein